jgi:asparagine synthase (glutamine-hydrolysing)
VCGICGKLNFDREKSVSPSLLKAMADAIYHRGPDDEGFYRSGAVGLGFRRLSIIDLNTGHQPLSNEDETVWNSARNCSAKDTRSKPTPIRR